MSIDTVLQIVAEEDLLDLSTAKRIAGRVFVANDLRVVSHFLRKLRFAFLRRDGVYRMDLIEHLMKGIKSFDEKDIIRSCQGSIVGNILVIYMFLSNYELIDDEKIGILQDLSKLKFLDDEDFRYFIPFDMKFKIAINAETDKGFQAPLIDGPISTLEILMIGDLLEESENTIRNILSLYGKSKNFSKKKQIFEFLLDGEYSHFLAGLKDISGTFNDFVEDYRDIYCFLLEKRIPVFFNYLNIEFSDEFSNKNAYPVLYRDRKGQETLLAPFHSLPIEDVGETTEIFDISSNEWIKLKWDFGKYSPSEIFSFRETSSSKNPTEKDIEKVKDLCEKDIEKFLGSILHDHNITHHGPGERADLFTVKLLLNNENDKRNAAFILKGKGLGNIHLKDISHQIYKACKLSVDIVVLVFTGNLDDDPRQCLIDNCRMKKKAWCIIDSFDLAKILLAHRMI